MVPSNNNKNKNIVIYSIDISTTYNSIRPCQTDFVWCIMKWFLAKGVPPLEGSGLPLASAMLRRSGDAEAENEDDEELGKKFEDPICALVQNCTMLHNIVGPACIFLRQSFAQSQLVCTNTLTNTPFLDNSCCGRTEHLCQNFHQRIR